MLKKLQAGIKMSNFFDKLTVRQLKKDDLDYIVDIDTKVLGETRRDYWVTKIVKQAETRPPDASLVSEIDGKVVGFILGEASGWEFKVPNNIGWIDTIGIDPDYQNRGIAKVLANALITNLKRYDVDTIYTLVNWNDWDLLQFFHAMGFSRGDMINLVLKV
jgi:ribosomal protein S18 acetylase RimI-like enzyme